MTDPTQQLIDLEEIRNLRIKYSHFLDGNSMTRLGELFSVDAVVDAGHGNWFGRDAIRAGLQQAFVDYDLEKRASYPFLHAVTNQWVEFVGPDTAEGRCYLIDLQTIAKPERDPWILLGMYADQYRRIGGRWFITRSRLDVVWPSRNLGGGFPADKLVLPVPAEG